MFKQKVLKKILFSIKSQVQLIQSISSINVLNFMILRPDGL